MTVPRSEKGNEQKRESEKRRSNATRYYTTQRERKRKRKRKRKRERERERERGREGDGGERRHECSTGGVHRPRNLPHHAARRVPIRGRLRRVPIRRVVGLRLEALPSVRFALDPIAGRRSGGMRFQEGSLLPPLRSPHPPRCGGHGIPISFRFPISRSFRLDRSSGAKCFMLSAKALSITWGTTPQYWSWAPHPDSRFPQVAMLLNVCWLEIRGKIESKLLSQNTTYAAYLIFKVDENYNGLSYPPQEATVILGSQVSERTLHLVLPRMGGQAQRSTSMFRSFLSWRGVIAAPQAQSVVVEEEEEEENEEEETSGVEVSPRRRDDGWMEVELGEFYNGEGEDGEVEMRLMEIRGGHWKRGLIVEGIEIKPKFA